MFNLKAALKNKEKTKSHIEIIKSYIEIMKLYWTDKMYMLKLFLGGLYEKG